MKFNKLKYLFFISALVATFWACSEDYLEVDAKGQFLTETYYANQEEAFGGLVAIYDMLKTSSGGAFDNLTILMNAGSDDHYAGGGGPSDVNEVQVFSNYTMNQTNATAAIWGDSFKGIFRANILLSKLPDVPMDGATKSLYEAESRALRAYFYFNLIRMYKSIPLILDPIGAADMYNITQVSREEVYAAIESDLSAAISVLPMPDAIAEEGRISKGAAIALLGKVYLYQGKNTQAANQFAEINGTPGSTSPYGYKLVDDFNELWSASNEFNSEGIFEISHSNLANASWGWPWPTPLTGSEGNMMGVMTGPRSYLPLSPELPEYGEGWSFNPVLPELYNLMKDDPRFDATILDLKTLVAEGKAEYLAAHQDTGYFLKKFIGKKEDEHTGGGDKVLNWRQNAYAIRLADTYLMEAEALGGSGARAQALLDAVRERVGLPSVPVTMDAIMQERRMELAGEGHRWFDLVRTGNAAAKLADRGFVAGKHEFFPIPEKELENTSLEQDPAYN